MHEQMKMYRRRAQCTLDEMRAGYKYNQCLGWRIRVSHGSTGMSMSDGITIPEYYPVGLERLGPRTTTRWALIRSRIQVKERLDQMI